MLIYLRYIFPGTEAPQDIQEQTVTGPAGHNDQPNTQFTYHWSQQEPLEIPGAGSVKIVDTTTFPASADISAALLTIKPGAMRELQ
jgi:oxalate decarboxylase/phosphoglucose isomerase-like protein (cupin superfamily)